jgi:hypothetical protein
VKKLIREDSVIIEKNGRLMLSPGAKRYLQGLMLELFGFTFDLTISMNWLSDPIIRPPNAGPISYQPFAFRGPGGSVEGDESYWPEESLNLDRSKWPAFLVQQLALIGHEVAHAHQKRAEQLAPPLTLPHDYDAELARPDNYLLTLDLMSRPRTGPNRVNAFDTRYTADQIAQLVMYRIFQDLGDPAGYTAMGQLGETWHPPYLP